MSLRAGTITLLHTACGAGILAVPYAFKPFGVIPGMLILLVCSSTAILGLLLQVKVTKYTPVGEKHSFFELASKIHPRLAVLFDIAIAIKCFGVATSYLIAVGDLLPTLLHSSNRFLLITLVWGFIIAPLSFLKKITALRYTSFLAVVSVIYLSILVTFHYADPSQEIIDLRGNVSLFFPGEDQHNSVSPFKTLPIFVFAYTCHHNMFAVLNEQSTNEFSKLKYIPLTAISIACIMYLIVGTFGYVTFGSNITSNIVAQYPTNSIATILGQTAMLTVVTLAFPLQCQPARASFINIINAFFPRFKYTPPPLQDEESMYISSTADSINNNNNQNSTPSTPRESTPNETTPIEARSKLPFAQEPTQFQHILLTTIILLGSWLIAISVKSLAHVLAIVGATGSTSISFILPGLFGAILISRDNSFEGNKKLWVLLGRGLLFWGCSVVVVSLYAALFM
ncbi:hypothetical protein TBLA_0F01400 [Henningerozyma blattae CBS 6284]|uniref:Amino acid transporter transmembrane domain-containing protein n=1 Tax=Henningerozyma blattae (strain ATCC 34711 / CBS 6284 / DSM 70876 / NBRC 10599 / NRRL Y-10934 / UCD 77-7) TaxID=1071380 RepID=I2H5N1_HENB6|nr:hypothetical protein TBLA_0F01400 [Tetrapisispora blattae CBS 6284]CCH61683.1 hypothetical protein TBLA_0F01400 [Tetrapisispora blattae CBS 6284]